MSTENIHTRIRQLRENAKISQGELARRIGISRSAVSQWESNKPKATSPDGENLTKCAIKLNTTPEFLLYGTENTAARETIRTKRISFYAWEDIVAASTIGDLQKNQKETIPVPFKNQQEEKLLETSFCFIVKGDSMVSKLPSPGSLYDGDMAIVNREAKPQNGDIVLAVTNAGKMLRVLKDNGNEKLLVALNDDYPRVYMDKSTLIWGVLIKSTREAQKIDI